MIKKEGKLALIEDCDKIIVVGDLHGDYEVYLKTKEFFKKGYMLVYLGDYADRGDFGLEIIEDLIDFHKKYPNDVLVLKGNHESFSEEGYPNFYPCDLISEVSTKIGDWYSYFSSKLKPFLDSMPLSAISLNFGLFFVHGGISSKIKNLNDLIEPSKEIEEDLLWSDPFEGNGEFHNPRGAGVLFGKNITEKFCSTLKIQKIIRGHEPRKAMNGPFYEHDGKVITVSSTRVYGGKAFVLKIENRQIDVIYLS